MVWAYMGPRSDAAAAARHRSQHGRRARTASPSSTTTTGCRCSKATIDTIHAVFLHSGSMQRRRPAARHLRRVRAAPRSTSFEVHRHAIGACYAAPPRWHAGQQLLAHRAVHDAVLRHVAGRGGPLGGGPSALTAAVPMDDEHTLYVKFAAVGRQPGPACPAGDRTADGWLAAAAQYD